MTTKSKFNDAQRLDATWVPIGFVLGAALGSYLNDTALGMSFGLLAGGTASAASDYKHGKQSIIWPIVGGFALLWIAALFVIERT